MDLDIRPVLRRGEKPGRRFTLAAPKIVVDGAERGDFHVLLQTFFVVVSSFTWDKVKRQSTSGNTWKIWSEDGQYHLEFTRYGRRLDVRGESCPEKLTDILRLVESQIDDEIAMQQDGEHDVTNVCVVNEEEVADWVNTKGFAPGKTMTVGVKPAKTPPPLPVGTYSIVYRRREKK